MTSPIKHHQRRKKAGIDWRQEAVLDIVRLFDKGGLQLRRREACCHRRKDWKPSCTTPRAAPPDRFWLSECAEEPNRQPAATTARDEQRPQLAWSRRS